jgi:uncharacterized protein (UPF0332 family)
MSLDDLEREELIKKLPVNKKKVEDTMQLAGRDIKTARAMLPQDQDWAFSIAYNAMLQTLRALMFSKGYRPSGGNQHISVVRFAEIFLDEETVVLFDRMRRKRHTSVYDTVGTISKKEAENAVENAEKLNKKINEIIKTVHL